MWLQRFSKFTRVFPAAIVAVLIALTSATAWSQGTTGFKGIWEPVNYGEDLRFNDVFFVTPETGYVAGYAGTILKTTDAGATWVPLLGGDPASQERPIVKLWFVTPTVGWATQITSSRTNLFRTRDGDTWEQIGVIDEHYDDIAFGSENDGIFVNDRLIYRTRDGGKSWSKTFECAFNAPVAGLMRQIACNLWKIRFASESVVYALGAPSGVTGAVVLRSADGGASWALATFMENESGTEGGLFFIDETTGYFSTKDGKSAFRTTDGGQTWSGMPATQIYRRIAFADPEVGWTMRYNDLSFTIDGGRRWSSRSVAFPATPWAFSMPRRDVAYVVGDHGMIYRHRVVSAGTPVAPNSMEGIAMPPLANGVIERIGMLENGLDTIESAFEATDSWPANGEYADWQVDDSSTWADSNVEEFGEFEQSLDDFSTGLPELGRKHRNINLVLEGLRILGDLSGQSGGLRQSLQTLRNARDLDAVSSALLEMNSQLEASKSSVTVFQSLRVSH